MQSDSSAGGAHIYRALDALGQIQSQSGNGGQQGGGGEAVEQNGGQEQPENGGQRAPNELGLNPNMTVNSSPAKMNPAPGGDIHQGAQFGMNGTARTGADLLAG
jgi:hypothetical protein